MKIIIVGPANPYRGGIADTNESLCGSLVEEEHDASLITFTVQYPKFLFPGKTQFTPDTKPGNVAITRLINSVNPFNWLSVAKKINELKPDLVIVRYWIPLLAPCLGSIVRLLNKNIVLIAMCDNVMPHEKRIGDKMLTRYFLNAFQGFITLSNTTYKELTSFTSRPKTYYPHPINNNLGEKIDQKAAREYLNLNPEGRYLLFFGLIRDYKGLDLTLKALGTPKVKELDIKLLIVGEFYGARDKYDELIEELDLKENVIIVDQFIPTAEIKYYFSAVDMVVQTYKSASQSGVSQVAFNFECPILVTNVGGLSEIVQHEQVGYVSERDPNQIAAYILDFFIYERRSVFSKNMGLEKHKYNWNAFAGQLLKLYEKLAPDTKNSTVLYPQFKALPKRITRVLRQCLKNERMT